MNAKHSKSMQPSVSNFFSFKLSPAAADPTSYISKEYSIMNCKKFLLFVVLVVSPMCVADQSDTERALSVQLTKAVTQINSNTPQKLDEDTRLDSVATFRNYIIYNNTMLNYTAEQLDVSLFDPLIQETIINPLCGNKLLSSFIGFGVVMVYRYHGKDGQFITELSKDMGTCKEK